jgi:hypothetical protein
MAETLFCYCCRIHHPKDQMRRFATRQGERWRWLRSIEAAGRSRGERDAFGHRHSDLNRLAASEQVERVATLHPYIRQS